MIHVCYSLHDRNGNYSKFTGTSIISMLENHNAPRTITIHILHDDTLTPNNRDKFSYIVGRYGQNINFYNVAELYADKIAEFKRLIPNINRSVLSIGAFYRFFSLDMLPPAINKLIYLDSDTIVNLDIAELQAIEIGDNALAAVPEAENGISPMTNPWDGCDIVREGLVKTEDYFNTGVLIMNLRRLRNEKDVLQRGLEFRAKQNTSSMDQYILNYCYSAQTLKLPIKYNCFVRQKRLLNKMAIENNIYHYLSAPSGFGMTLDLNDSFSRLWFEYFAMTPWFNADAIANLEREFRSIYADRQKFAAQISAMVAGKQRVFLVLPKYAETIVKAFYIRPDEEVILINSTESLQLMVDRLKSAGGQKFLFTITVGYDVVKDWLSAEGFVEGRDFVNGMAFLSDANGSPLDTWSLLNAM